MKNASARQIFVTLLLLFLTVFAFAQSVTEHEEAVIPTASRFSEVSILQQKLADETEQLHHSEKYLASLRDRQFADKTTINASLIDAKMIQEAEFNVGLAEVQYEKISLELTTARKNIALAQNYLDQYEKQLINARAQDAKNLVEILKGRVEREKQKLDFETVRVKVLTQLLAMNADILMLEREHLSALTEQVRLEEVAGIWAGQQRAEEALVELQQNWEVRLAQYRQALDKIRPIQTPPTSKQTALQNQIFEAEENIQLLKVRLTLTRIGALLDAYQKRNTDGETSRRYLELSERLEKLKDELYVNHILVENKQVLLRKQLAMLETPGADLTFGKEGKKQLSQMLNEVNAAYDQEDVQINALTTRLVNFRNELLQGAKQTWQTRQKLPRSLRAWEDFGKDLWVLPQVVFQSLVSTYYKVVDNLSYASPWMWGMLSVLMMAWTIFWIWIGRVLDQFLMGAKDKGMSFSANAFIVLVQLLDRNIMGIAIFGAIIILLVLLNVTGSYLIVPLSLGGVWFVYKIAIGLARISLFENIWDISGKDVKLYQGLRWSLGLGSFIVALTVLAHQLPIPLDIVASFDRIFMLVLLGVSLPLLKGWHVFPNLLAQEGKTKPYFRRAVQWASVLIPLIIFSNAVIGLVGYVSLAWTMWIAEAQFLLVLTFWLIARGILGDVMETLAKLSIRHLKSGWVWTESLLKPLNQLLQLALLIAALSFLFIIYGFDQNPAIMSHVHALATESILGYGQIQITALNIIQFVVLIIVIRWAAKWSREFAYRFIFAKQKDKGLRNSMAVFTQYATIGLGVFLVLQVIGIDLTTLTVVLGALAVGIGFGLQGIANNLVSGLLLLIERPFRVGDIITLGTHEGEVTNIGVRATTVRTWDNMEVIIPNAETVAQSLTNWTHHDTIVRTTLNVRIGFTENPHQAQAVILQTLRQLPSVVENPEPSVLLFEYGEFSIVFQIRYFIDLSLGKGRAIVRSEVLLAIWDSLRVAGIDIPYPRQLIDLNERKDA